MPETRLDALGITGYETRERGTQGKFPSLEGGRETETWVFGGFDVLLSFRYTSGMYNDCFDVCRFYAS